jgi:hypothetical protein
MLSCRCTHHITAVDDLKSHTFCRLTPGNRHRFSIGALTNYGGSGTGTGGCNATASDDFNGAEQNRMTCVLQWFQVKFILKLED